MRPKRGSFKKFICKIEGKGSPKSYCKLPPISMWSGLNPTRKALAGSLEDLQMAFSWSDTPQGHLFWSDIRHGDKPHTEESIKFLEYLLDERNHTEGADKELAVSLARWEMPNEEE